MHALVCPLCRIALSPTDSVCPRDGHAGREMAWLSVPPALGHRFHTLQPFAHGDSGSLYIADEPETGRRGLLKVLAPVAKEQLAERQRLRRELVKQATLARTHLVVPHASGDAEGVTWIFREWLEGLTLEVRLSRGGPLQQTEALAIAAQIAGALDELHRGGLLHRDIKPGHVFLQPTSHGLPRVLLLDAGIVSPIALRTGTVYGTPGYVAPEQLLGNLVSFRSDLYSLGSVLYRMLTGRPAFEGDDDARILEAQRQGALPQVPPTLPPGIRQLLQSLLAREPQERPFSAQKLRRTLEPFLPDDALIERNPTSSFEMLPRERKPAAVMASGTLRPPPPPSVRASASGSLPSSHPEDRRPSTTAASPGATMSAPAASPEPRSEDRTDSVDLEQVEEQLQARSQPPPTPPGAQQTSDKTMPIRLDQILAVADGRRGASRPPPALVEPTREDATLVDPPHEPAPPSAAALRPSPADAAPSSTDFRPREAAPLGADFRPRPDAAPLAPMPSEPRSADPSGHRTLPAPIAPPSESTIEIDDQLARVIAEHERQQGSGSDVPRGGVPAAKRTLVGMGATALRDPASASGEGSAPVEPALPEPEAARSTGPGEPAPRFASPKSTLPLGSALPSAASLQGVATPSAVQPGAAAALEPRAPSVQPGPRSMAPRSHERDVPTEPIPLSSSGDDDSLVTSPWWLFGGDKRRALIYGSAALVGVAVLGVGVSALFSGEPAKESVAVAERPAPPALPAVAEAPREPAAAEPVTEAASPAPDHAARPVRERAGPSTTAKAPAPAKPAKLEPPARREAKPEPKREAHKPSTPAKTAAPSKPPVAKEPPPSKPAAPDNAALFAEAADQARAHYSAKRYKDAAAAYERAIRYDAGNAGIYAGLGAARLQLGDDRGAVQAYQRAVQLAPSNSKFHSALGQAYLLMGDTGRARSAYKQALSLDPKNESAKNALSKL